MPIKTFHNYSFEMVTDEVNEFLKRIEASEIYYDVNILQSTSYNPERAETMLIVTVVYEPGGEKL